MYTLNGISKTYRKGDATVRALDSVDITIADGEFLAVQGRTGSGKTTLLQILGALDRPSTGQLRLDDRDLAAFSERELTELRAAAIGFVFQTFNLIPTLSAIENVEAALVPLHLSGSERRQRSADALEAVGLSDRLQHLPSELSGGQQQRVGIARALVKNPQVLLADEPTGNLDEQTRDEIIDLLEDLSNTRRLTLVIVTHDRAIARRAPRIAHMRDGKLALPGEAEPPSEHGSVTSDLERA